MSPVTRMRDEMVGDVRLTLYLFAGSGGSCAADRLRQYGQTCCWLGPTSRTREMPSAPPWGGEAGAAS